MWLPGALWEVSQQRCGWSVYAASPGSAAFTPCRPFGGFQVLFLSPSAVVELPDWMGLSGLTWLFTAVQMHLHWGSGGPSHGGSEHTINGLSADAEVRLNTAH